MKTLKPQCLFFFFFLLNLLSCLLFHVAADHDKASSLSSSSIVFSTFGRSFYGFDIFSVPLWDPPGKSKEIQLTDGKSVNFNGYFPSSASLSMHTHLPDHTTSPPPINLVYVTERNGSTSILLDSVSYYTHAYTGSEPLKEAEDKTESRERVKTELKRVQVPLVGIEHPNGRISMKDRPSLVGASLVYVSTHEDPGVPRESWAAVYSTQLKTGLTRRLTPKGFADFSPSVSPSGVWTAVASFGEKGWKGEIEELATDIYVFLTRDGSNRVKIVNHGGWPSWVDDSTLYFHRRCEDGWWSVFKATLPKNHKLGVDSVVTQRVTPPGLHAFTPAASLANKRFIAVATRRANSEYRHIELFDIVLNEFKEITRPIAPNSHHYNPFISPDGIRMGYHRCRGVRNGVGSANLVLQNIQNSIAKVNLFRFSGFAPSFSPDGNRIAYINFPGLYVVNIDGSGLREVLPNNSFTTAWDPIRKGVIYTSIGPILASESTMVDIISINVDMNTYKKLTSGGENNAYPSPSPDGKWVVFRSGRSGHKNLYIMDALKGEAGGLYQLTKGPWTDTFCTWSPDGEWIAFSSNRENPDGDSFALYKIHPNGTNLHKLIQSGSGGQATHPWFSPDGKYIVFTADYAGVSAEPISYPNHFQPSGDIFLITSDGSGIQRLTHNSYQDGTPTWAPNFIKPVDVEFPDSGPKCMFDDCRWLNISSKPAVSDVHLPASSKKIQCYH